MYILQSKYITEFIEREIHNFVIAIAWLVLILHGEAVEEGEPGGAEHDVLLCGLLLIPPGGVLLPRAVVITIKTT